MKGEFGRAAADYIEAARLDQSYRNSKSAEGFALPFFGRAMKHHEAGLFDRALADYDQAYRVDPAWAAALYGRGLVKLRIGDESGRADMADAIALKADVARGFDLLNLR